MKLKFESLEVQLVKPKVEKGYVWHHSVFMIRRVRWSILSMYSMLYVILCLGNSHKQ